jgi:hypothetical protein
LLFNDIGFKVTPLNSTFKSLNDKIAFTGNTIVFNQFVIKRRRDNDLVINGKIDSQNFSNIGYDLTLDAVNFKAINSEEKDNDLLWRNVSGQSSKKAAPTTTLSWMGI